MTIDVRFISISGNTRAFIQKLVEFAKAQHGLDENYPLIQAKEVHLQRFLKMKQVTFSPLYQPI